MNKDFKIWMAAALCTACLCACNEEENIPTGEGKGAPIGFTAGIDGSTTRAQLTTTASMNSMSLFIYETTGSFDPSASTPNYAFDLAVMKEGSAWTYSPTLYWPGADTDRLSFFAITPAPTTDNGITVETTESTAGYPAFRIAPPTSPTQQADFCIATILNATYETPNGDGSTPAATEADKGKVSLPFAHALSKIRFKAHYTTSSTPTTKSGVDIESVTIESIEITGVAGSGKMQFATKDGKCTWTENTGTDGKYTLRLSEGELASALLKKEDVTTEDADTVSTRKGILCLVPQTIPDGAQLKVVVKGKDPDGKTIGYLFRTPLTGTWEAGKAYTYQLEIKDMDVELTTTETWNFTNIKSANNKAQLFTVPANGIYKIEIWGNQGGNFEAGYDEKNINGGKGGYTAGEIELTKGDMLNIYVGESDYSSNYTKGWNGGGCAGAGTGNKNGVKYPFCSPGGGSIDVRFKEMKGNYGDLALDNATDSDPLIGLTGIEETDPRIIVGGGGGGLGANDIKYDGLSFGGYAGGESGGDSYITNQSSQLKTPHPGGKGGTSAKGGENDGGDGVVHYTKGQTEAVAGSGAHTGKKEENDDESSSGGGGGGWWGGGCGTWYKNLAGGGGGGGSSHVHSKLFTKIVYKAGNELFKSPDGVDETGHAGAGLVRITRWPDSTPTPAP